MSIQRQANFTIPSRNHPMTAAYAKSWKSGYAEKRVEMRYMPNGVLRELNDNRRWRRAKRSGLPPTRSVGGWAAPASLARSTTFRRTAKPTTRWRSYFFFFFFFFFLCPKTHPIGTKRLCVDSGYFETYNRDNVDLVNISQTPIKRLTPDGLIVNGRGFTFDAIVFATGFDAMTDTLFNVDIRGRAGLELKSKWAAGPRTYLGLMTESFPNLFMITGPGSPSVKSNMITSIEQPTWLPTPSSICTVIEPKHLAKDEWVDHVQEVVGEGYEGFRFQAEKALAAE